MVQLRNTQYSHFLQQADALRRSGALCDVVVSVDGQTFRAHRLVLVCASGRLANQLSGGGVEAPVHCSLELFSPRTFQQVLDFCYSREMEVPGADLPQLLKASQLLEMPPLEAQCRSQLDTLHQAGDTATAAAEEPRTEVETQIAEEREERPASEGSPSPRAAEGPSSPPAPMKRPRPVIAVPTSEASPSRDSVIASAATGHGPRSPSRYRWHSVNAMRLAWNYSDLMASHSLLPSQQALAYPFPLSAPHVYPLLASSIPAQAYGSVLGYHGILHPYTPTLLAGSPELGDVLKAGLRGATDPADKAQMGDGAGEAPRYGEEHPGRAGRIQGCQHCARTLLERPWLHTSTSSPSGEASLGCGFCGRGYKLGRVLRPPRRGHGGEKPYQCKRCPKRFSLKHQLDTHHRVHTGEKPFECRLCAQRSRDYSAMIKHLRTHGGATPYQCTVCLEFCSSLAAMQKHLKSHTLQEFPPDWKISSTYMYTCHS